MLYNTTTYYKTQDHTEILQTLQERYAGGHGQRPAGSASAAKNGRRKPVEAFSGVGRPFPPSAPGFVRPGRSWTAWARCPALGLHRHSWRCGSSAGGRHRRKWRSWPARRPGRRCRPSLLASNLRPSRQRWRLRLGTASANRFSLLNLAFLGFRAAAALDEGEGVELVLARLRPRLW